MSKLTIPSLEGMSWKWPIVIAHLQKCLWQDERAAVLLCYLYNIGCCLLNDIQLTVAFALLQAPQVVEHDLEYWTLCGSSQSQSSW